MKKMGFILLIVFLSASVKAQQVVRASISTSCVSQPATIAVPSGKIASGFVLKTLVSGNNCYSGASFANKGFVIKSSNGAVVYSYNRDANGKVQESGGALATLKLSAGTYTVWVDGGKGAQLILSYRI